MTTRKTSPPAKTKKPATPIGPATNPPPPALTERLTFLLHTAGARIANIGNRHFREHDLNHYSARILVLLLENEELRTGDLVERMVLPQSTISSQLQALHKKRLIRRRRSRQDNRSVMVTLTPAGLELARDCNALSLRVHEEVVSTIGSREWQLGHAFLRKINERLVVLEKQDLYPFHGVAQIDALGAGRNEPRPAKRTVSRKTGAGG